MICCKVVYGKLGCWRGLPITGTHAEKYNVFVDINIWETVWISIWKFKTKMIYCNRALLVADCTKHCQSLDCSITKAMELLCTLKPPAQKLVMQCGPWLLLDTTLVQLQWQQGQFKGGQEGSGKNKAESWAGRWHFEDGRSRISVALAPAISFLCFPSLTHLLSLFRLTLAKQLVR